MKVSIGVVPEIAALVMFIAHRLIGSTNSGEAVLQMPALF